MCLPNQTDVEQLKSSLSNNSAYTSLYIMCLFCCECYYIQENTQGLKLGRIEFCVCNKTHIEWQKINHLFLSYQTLLTVYTSRSGQL